MGDNKLKIYNVKTLTKPNFIIYNLKGKITNKLWEDEEDKECVLEYVYKFCQDNQYMQDKIEKLAELLELSTETIRKYAKKYALTYLGLTEEQYNEQKQKYTQIKMKKIYQRRQTKIKQVYEQLLKTNAIEEIVSIIENSQVELIQIRERVTDFVIVHKDNDEKIEKEIKHKIKMYLEYKMEQKNKEIEELNKKENAEKLPRAIKLISIFLNDRNNISIEEYCKIKNTSIDTFNEYVEILKNNDSELYYLYLKKIELLQNQTLNNNLEKIKLIILYIKNGIEEYGQVRDFDIIDYFTIFDIKLDKILKMAKDHFSKEDYIVLAKFVDKNISGIKNSAIFVNQVMKDKIVIRNENKALRVFTEEILEEETKKDIIDYLKEHNVPINIKTFNTALKRYKQGILNITKDKTKK